MLSVAAISCVVAQETEPKTLLLPSNRNLLKDFRIEKIDIILQWDLFACNYFVIILEALTYLKVISGSF